MTGMERNGTPPTRALVAGLGCGIGTSRTHVLTDERATPSSAAISRSDHPFERSLRARFLSSVLARIANSCSHADRTAKSSFGPTPAALYPHRMREAFGGPLRAAGLTAFIAGCAWLLLDPPSSAGISGTLIIIAAAGLIIFAMGLVTVMMIGEEMPEAEFRRIVDRSDRLAMLPPPDRVPSEFDELVIDALDELPPEFLEVLHDTPVTVSNQGHVHHAYGQYIGGTIARDVYPDHIVIYEDTLTRDFGHDPRLLRAQVQRTVRHEVAHHLGWDERGVRGLGL